MPDWNQPPYLITQRKFWACPTHVFTGLTFLLVGIAIGALIMFAATPAAAQDYTRYDCAERATTASFVMGMRQRGWDRETVLRRSTDDPTQRMVLSMLVDAAWAEPRYDTEYAQRLAQDAFMRGVFNGCIKQYGAIMTMCAHIDYDETTGEYHRVRLTTVKDVMVWQSGNIIRDWYQMVKYSQTIQDTLIIFSSLQHFLFDVPGYRTVERPDGEYIVWDAKDGDPSPRDADWTHGIVNGWDVTGIGSDGWPKGWKRGNRYAWRVVAQPTGKPHGIYWRTADLDVIFENHAYHDTQEQAFSRN